MPPRQHATPQQEGLGTRKGWILGKGRVEVNDQTIPTQKNWRNRCTKWRPRSETWRYNETAQWYLEPTYCTYWSFFGGLTWGIPCEWLLLYSSESYLFFGWRAQICLNRGPQYIHIYIFIYLFKKYIYIYTHRVYDCMWYTYVFDYGNMFWAAQKPTLSFTAVQTIFNKYSEGTCERHHVVLSKNHPNVPPKAIEHDDIWWFF